MSIGFLKAVGSFFHVHTTLLCHEIVNSTDQHLEFWTRGTLELDTAVLHFSGEAAEIPQAKETEKLLI